MQAQVQSLLAQLSQPQHMEQARQQLQQLATNGDFFATLLGVAVQQQDLQAAIFFKNQMVEKWPEVSGVLTAPVRVAIKQALPDAVCASVPNTPVQQVLAAALQEVAKHDFPDEWPQLLPHLLLKIAPAVAEGTPVQHADAVAGALGVADALFARYRHEARSNKLWLEIKNVLEVIASPLSVLAQKCEASLQDAGMRGLTLMVISVYRSLTSQELPEVFEDSLNPWMNFMGQILSLPAGEKTTELKTNVLEILRLFTDKYDDRVADYIPTFLNFTLELLAKEQGQYSTVMGSGIEFVAAVARQEWHKSLFEKEAVQAQIVRLIVLPNVLLRDTDLDEFVEGLEYVRRDLEGSDRYTPRRTCADLLQALRRHFDHGVSALVMQYIQEKIGGGSSAEAMREQDAALYLLSCIAVNSATMRDGAVKINEKIDVAAFFEKHVLPILQTAPNDNPCMGVLHADALKFVSIFRSQFPVQQVTGLLALAGSLFASEFFVVQTYAATVTAQLLARVSREKNENAIDSGILSQLMNALMQALSGDQDADQYYMKAIVRVCQCVPPAAMAQVAPSLLQKLTQLLDQATRNFRSHDYVSATFDAICVALSRVAQAGGEGVKSCMPQLAPLVQMDGHMDGHMDMDRQGATSVCVCVCVCTCVRTLGQDAMMSDERSEEVGHYVFQLYGHLLHLWPRLSQEALVPEMFVALFVQLLQPSRWKTESTQTRALAALIRAYLARDTSFLVADKAKRLVPLLQVWAKLIQSRAHDDHCMSLILPLVDSLSPTAWQEELTTVINLTLRRLAAAPTAAFARNTILLVSLLVARHGLEQTQQVFEAIQPGLLKMVAGKVLADADKMQSVQALSDCRVVFRGLLALVLHPQALSIVGSELWLPLLTRLIALLDDDIDVDTEKALREKHLEELAAHGASSTKGVLPHAHRTKFDPCTDVKEPRKELAQAMNAFLQQHPDAPVAQLPAEYVAALKKYGVALGDN